MKYCFSQGELMDYLIVEDAVSQADFIKNTILNTFKDSVCTIASNYESAKDMILNNHFQVFILDIDLGDKPSKSGIELGMLIRTIPRHINTPILFTTSLPEKMPDAINNIHCYSYLIKPYSQDSLVNALNSLHGSSLITENSITLREPKGLYFRLLPSEIVFVEVLNHTLLIHTKLNTFRSNEYSIKSFCELIPNVLTQCHKSFAVNIKHISAISNSEIFVDLNKNNVSIPIGRSYKDLIIKGYKI